MFEKPTEDGGADLNRSAPFLFGVCMPPRVERCVKSLMADPKFKAKKPGQSKKDAAWALCTWLDGQGKLKATTDGVKITMDKAELLFTGPFKLVLPITGARRQIVEKAEGVEEVQLWLHIEASGPERDRDGDRFSPVGLGKMVEYASKSKLPFLDGHYRDLLAAMFGDVYNPFLTEQKHFAFDVLLNSDNPFAIQLFNDVLAGKRHGASIAGVVHDAEIEEHSEGEFGRVFNDVELIEVSRTSWPSYRDSFITLLANKVGKLPQDEFDQIVKRRNDVIELARKSVVAEFDEHLQPDPPASAGKVVNEVRIVLAQNEDNVLGAEVVTVKEDKQQEILDLVKGLVQTTEAAMKSSYEDKEEVMNDNKISSDEDATEVIMDKKEVPAAVEETPVEETPVVEVGPKEEPVVEQEAETVTETETETPPVEQEVKQSEVVGETLQKLEGNLAENVDTRMMRRRFGVLTYTMQEMVEDSVRRGKGDEAFSVIDDFAREGKDVISKLIDAKTPVMAGSFLDPFEEAIELATGRLSKSRVDRLVASRESAIKDDLEFIEVLKNIDAVDDSKIVVATEKAEKVEQTVSELAKRVDEQETKDQESAEAVAKAMRERSEALRKAAEALTVEPVREEVGPAVETEPIEISPENKYEHTKKKWLDGMRRK